MGAGEREADQVVIEAGRLPGVSRVTLLAVLRESRRNVVRICSLLVIGQVAAHTIGGRAFIFAADVARGAVQRGVHAGQSEAGELQVIEARAEPRVHGVAQLATGAEAGCHVAGTSSPLERLRVAGVALGRHRGEVAQSTIFVTRGAVQRRVGSHQREPIVVVLNRFNRYVPAIHRVTLFASCTHLGAMDIGMAVGALGANVGKHGLGMALRAHHSLVHTAQREACLVVIKLRHAANRFPSQRGVAIGASHVERSMRTSGLG